VIIVYIEATPTETETRLLRGLRKRCPSLPIQLGLKETLATLRRGQGLPVGKKVLIVLDQLEQWLHAQTETEDTDLVQALRQCDGGRVQCLVMVRDDFWMATTRFLTELEIELLQGQNVAAADLFDLRHAKKVLTSFGQAFGLLSGHTKEVTPDQKHFLEEAVSSLAQENKVICVRLALFAEMMKGRPWTPATLKEVGGTEGVGVTFLEAAFSSPMASPRHRLHQKAARAVLRALLPESGTDIRGHMRSYAELLEASGYASRPKEFGDLIHILDSELRLITPTDPEGMEAADESGSHVEPGQRYYQLTHDYLVQSLREWLTRKQKETRRGRAELLLADRAAVWNARPENRQLPSLLQWATIRWWTRRKEWTVSQRKMMRKATRYHAVRGMIVAVLLGLFGWASYEGTMRLDANFLEQRLLNVDTTIVPEVVRELGPYRGWINPMLYADLENTHSDKIKLHASLALVPVDPNQVGYLYTRLLDAEPAHVPVIRDSLAAHSSELVDRLWSVAEAPAKGQEHQRLRAAAALARYDPEGQRWATVRDPLVNDLVRVPAADLATWMGSLHPVRGQLLAPLAAVYHDSNRKEMERGFATDILAAYAGNRPQVLADLLLDADDRQFAVLYSKLKGHGDVGREVLQAEIDRKLPPDAKDAAKERLAKRQANAAVALLRMNHPANVWPLLKHSPDPRVRSYLIHRFGPLDADAAIIVERLNEEPDVTIRRALILCLGPEEFKAEAWAPEERKLLVQRLQEMYCTAADPGLHAATEWLLRQWQQAEWLRQTNETWARDKEQREKRLNRLKQELTEQRDQPPQWYVNSQGQTMVVIPGPVEFVMGSPPTEVGRVPNELQHKRRIGRTFALATKSVTVEQYRRFNPRHGLHEIDKWARTADSPVIAISWFQAAAYCNWLSKQEGLPESEWCYEPLLDYKTMPALAGGSTGLLAGSLGSLAAAGGLFPRRTDPEYKEGMKLARNYLRRTGYRLPTEAEMEYATRAGAVTSRYFGDADELLEKYAWYQRNSQERTWPVGSKKPNDTGLFDMHGNVYTWCQERYREYPRVKGGEVTDDKEDALTVANTDSRLLRGGTFSYVARYVRSAYRGKNLPSDLYNGVGIRLARTLLP
jgi:formylglycine-generating enzyme required for sulfatase activity